MKLASITKSVGLTGWTGQLWTELSQATVACPWPHEQRIYWGQPKNSQLYLEKEKRKGWWGGEGGKERRGQESQQIKQDSSWILGTYMADTDSQLLKFCPQASKYAPPPSKINVILKRRRDTSFYLWGGSSLLGIQVTFCRREDVCYIYLMDRRAYTCQDMPVEVKGQPARTGSFCSLCSP